MTHAPPKGKAYFGLKEAPQLTCNRFFDTKDVTTWHSKSAKLLMPNQQRKPGGAWPTMTSNNIVITYNGLLGHHSVLFAHLTETENSPGADSLSLTRNVPLSRQCRRRSASSLDTGPANHLHIPVRHPARQARGRKMHSYTCPIWFNRTQYPAVLFWIFCSYRNLETKLLRTPVSTMQWVIFDMCDLLWILLLINRMRIYRENWNIRVWKKNTNDNHGNERRWRVTIRLKVVILYKTNIWENQNTVTVLLIL